jgi:hypothetical protein
MIARLWSVIIRVWLQRRAWVQWLLSPRLFWDSLLALSLALVFAFWHPITERHVRWAGLWLIVLGTAQGFAALISTRRQFRVPSLFEHVKRWLNNRPRPNTTIAMGGVGMSISSGSADLTVHSQMGPERTTEERLAAIEANIVELQRQVDGERQRNAAALSKLRSDLDARHQATETALAATTRKLLDSQTGGLWQAVAALAFIFVGTIFSGLAPDVASGAPLDNVQLTHVSGNGHTIAFLFGALGSWLSSRWQAFLGLPAGPWSEWAGAVGTLAVAAIAIFLEPYRAWRRRAKLSAITDNAPPHCVVVAIGRTPEGKDINATYLRIWVENIGNLAATKVEVFASALRRTDPMPASITEFPPMNLLWANTEREIFAERLSPSMGRHCDVCRIINPQYRVGVEDAKHLGLAKDRASLAFGLVVSPNHQRHIVAPGAYVLTVKIAAENCKPVDYDVEVTFDGVWSDSQDEMIGKHVSIVVRAAGASAKGA